MSAASSDDLTSADLRAWWPQAKAVTEEELGRDYGLGLWPEHIWPVARDTEDEHVVVFMFDRRLVLQKDDEVRVYTRPR